MQTTLASYRQAHGDAEAAVKTAARWVSLVAQPLLDQYQDELREAIAPFFANPAESARTLLGTTQAHAALKSFLGQGEFLAQRNFTTKELLEQVTRWTGLVEAVLTGSELFTYKADALASA